MNVISKPNLFQAAQATKNPQLVEKVARWYELARRNDVGNLVELQTVFPSSQRASRKLLFNLGAYRLICSVSFLRRAFFFKALLTHAEYDKGAWKS